MTVDDENSVYVGNLPYDATEDSIRSVFDIYGQIIAVKIINDRGVGGKCYGFVTFTNPRSAVDAINDMDGRTVDGRVVKVNEVKSRGGRSNFGRERDNFRRNSNDRDVEVDRGRDRERNYGRVRDRSRDLDQDKERGYERARDLDRTRNRFIDRDTDTDRDRDRNRDRGHEGDQAWENDRDQEKEIRRNDIHHRSGNKYKDQTTKLQNGEHPSGSSHGDHDHHAAKQLDVSRQKIEELQKEVYRMEELVEEKGDHVSKLQEKSQKLEDALASAKKLTSNRKKQLIKLHKCFVNMRDYSEKLKSCEEELQALVGSTLKELESHNVVDTDGLMA
ncbi:uncharacterized protein LOC111883884 isoform X2 [Lactuca sativa]|uniref:uncharacterized protein LOC111883884 isoform X2 n=1 Tax=Lactuca sativa TaxID=4236 RepID=UPI000CD9CA6C|nr:uncharacterized protein LOC111883884 isoform X2 [Lactuca sativa]